MKHHLAYYLSLSTLLLVGVTSTTTTSSQHLRGRSSDDEHYDIVSVAPPRLSEEHSLPHYQIIEPQSSSSLASSSATHDHHERRALQSNNNDCNNNEHSLSITLTSDRHSNADNTFTISTKGGDETTNNNNSRWNALYTASGELNNGPITMCISPSNNRYRFEAIDSYSDGIIGGYYELSLDGVRIFRTPDGQWSRSVHKFTVGTEEEENVGIATTAGDKSDNIEEELEVFELKMGTGFPTSVVVPNPAPATPPSSISGGNGSASINTAKPPTPKPSPPPAAKPEPVVTTTTTTTVSTGIMTEREHQWLDEHNVRREKYHKQKGKTYVPLQWSKYLRDSAQQWAEECARTNTFDHAWHLNIGENMARHTTSGDGYRHPSNILTRWVEKELGVGYPANGHMTQALWRATKFVGCGEARRGNRYYQVCQYSKPGNCGVKRSDYWSSVMADDSGCKGMPLLY